MLCSTKLCDSGNCQHIGSDSLNLRTHPDQHTAQLLHIWFASSIIYDGLSFRKDGSHKDIGSTCYRCLVKKHIPALQVGTFRYLKMKGFHIGVIFLLGSKVHETKDMGIYSASADLISSRLREICPAEACKKRSDHHH